MKNILFYLSTNSAFPIMPEDIILQFLLYNCVYIQMCRCFYHFGVISIIIHNGIVQYIIYMAIS